MGVQINGDTGNISATKADYSGNVTIGGTLTYEDVTNIDSVGLITAREGIEIGASPGVGASISVDGNAIFSGITTIGGNVKVGSGVTLSPDGDVFFTGITTVATLRATTGIVTAFQGDIVIEDKIIHSGDTNTNIRFPAADTITVETSGSERARIDSSGHMGLGVTPNANWPTNDDFKALQLGTGACVFGRGTGDDDRAGFAANYYATGSGNAYLANGHANLIYLNDGNINCYTAPQNSSGAGAAMSLVEVLSVNTNGYVTKPKNLCLSYTASSSLNYTSSGTLIYGTEVFDVGDSNAYNTSTGVFTAPITGIYNIYHEYYNVTGYNAMTKLIKSTDGGSNFSQIKIFGRQRNDDAYTSAGFSHLVQANANDQFKITWYDGQVHINNTFTHMHIQLVQ